MKKKIFIGIGLVLILAIGFVGYRIATTRNLSPKGTASYSKNGLEISVTYGRPLKKGRLIFGPEEKDALVPFGKYWRLGANEATEITFNKDVDFGGVPVKAGSYRLYAIPSAKSWMVILNSELGKWGAFEPDPELDVQKVETTPERLSEPVEQFTIDLEEEETKALLNFKWDSTKVTIPVK